MHNEFYFKMNELIAYVKNYCICGDVDGDVDEDGDVDGYVLRLKTPQFAIWRKNYKWMFSFVNIGNKVWILKLNKSTL